MFKRKLAHIQFSVIERCVEPIISKNTCYLQKDNWNDFGFYTSFNVYFVNQNKQLKYLGQVRITCKGLPSGKVELPTSPFTSLPNNYCSLGDQGYYEELMELEEEEREVILNQLRDCVYHRDIFEEFKEDQSFRVSLLRDVTDNMVKNLFPSILSGDAKPTPYHFFFKINGNDSTKIEVEVTPYSNPSTNIHVLIGRNGVGKTRILSGLVASMTENKIFANFSENVEVIFDNRTSVNTNQSLVKDKNLERFTHLISVTFSVFDNLKPITSDDTKIRYQYIGLKDNNNRLKLLTDLKDEFIESIKMLQGSRRNRWKDAINILNSDPILKDYELLKKVTGNNSDLQKLKDIFDELSSGHKIILFTITKLTQLVDEKTLVLIDEPENHLHPPLLSAFVRVISDLLIKRNAVAVIATHSPVVLQEIPKSCITRIEKVGSEYSLFRPQQETYGENIGTITREIFGLEVLESGFYKTVQSFLEKTADYDALINNFGGKLGSDGRAIARSIIARGRDA